MTTDVTDTTRTALICTDMVVRFGAVHALNGCSLTLPERGAISIIGENGSGKSTLLDVLSGFTSLTSGAVTDGDGKGSSRAELRRAACRLHQRVVLPSDLSVHEYLSICARAATAGKPSTPQSFFDDTELHANDELTGLLSAAGVNDRAWPLEQLSLGQQRIAAICGIIAAPKRTVLLDEPMAGIAREVRKVVMDVIKHAARDRLVVFSEHDLRYAARADRVIALKGGEVVRDLPANEFPEMLSLMQYYGD